jgi:dephospho-CoA kinase
LILGVTGGIATGKSTVSHMFQKHSAILIDADQVAREVVKPKSSGLAQIIEHFGEGILHRDQSLNRKKLGDIIFKDKTERAKLEKIFHPLIRDKMITMTEAAFRDESKVVVWDVPLLVENKLFSFVDDVILVYAPVSFQIRRLVDRDALTEQEALQRISAQIPIEEKRKYANFLIDNQGSIEFTQRQVDTIWAELTKKRK